MKYRLHIFLLVSCLLFASRVVHAGKLDSLRNGISLEKSDTQKVNLLLDLSKEFRNTSADSAMFYAVEARKLAEEHNYQKGIGYALKAIGMAYNVKGDYVEALRYWKESLRIFEESSNKEGVANMLNNIGVIYYNRGDEAKALDYYIRSLKVSEEIGDKHRIATALMNVGGVYSNKSITYDKALQYHTKALALSKAINDSELIGSSNANLGELYLNMHNLDSALFYLKAASTIHTGTADLSYTLNTIGKVYHSMKNYDKAIQYHQRAYDTAKVLDDKLSMAQAKLGIAAIYMAEEDYPMAIRTYEEARILFEGIGLDEGYDLKSAYEGLAKCYIHEREFEKALQIQTKLIDLTDKLYNVGVTKQLETKLFSFEMEKKQNEINLQQEIISRQKLLRNGLIGGFVIVLLFAGVFFKQRNKISKEKQRSDNLLLNILPAETAEELKQTGGAKAREFKAVSVLFTDFKNFSHLSEVLNAQELVNEIHQCYSVFDTIISKYGIEKIKTIGDSYMCAAGLPVEKESHAEDIIKAGIDIRDFIQQEKQRRIAQNKPYFEIRVGVHSGPLVAGIVGIKKFAYDIWGDTVNIASRMESSGVPGKVNISGTTHDLVKDKFHCTYRGKIEAKNKGRIDMYFVEKPGYVETETPPIAVQEYLP